MTASASETSETPVLDSMWTSFGLDVFLELKRWIQTVAFPVTEFGQVTQPFCVVVGPLPPTAGVRVKRFHECFHWGLAHDPHGE